MYETLLKKCEEKGLTVHEEKMLDRFHGLIRNNRIMINSELSRPEKICALAEEIGHYETTVGNILDQSKIVNRKQERDARVVAYKDLLSVPRIINAYHAGVRNRFELAEYLDITEKFIDEALTWYKETYGIGIEFENYYISFNDGLSVFESFE